MTEGQDEAVDGMGRWVPKPSPPLDPQSSRHLAEVPFPGRQIQRLPDAGNGIRSLLALDNPACR